MRKSVSHKGQQASVMVYVQAHARESKSHTGTEVGPRRRSGRGRCLSLAWRARDSRRRRRNIGQALAPRGAVGGQKAKHGAVSAAGAEAPNWACSGRPGPQLAHPLCPANRHLRCQRPSCRHLLARPDLQGSCGSASAAPADTGPRPSPRPPSTSKWRCGMWRVRSVRNHWGCNQP